MGSRSRLEWSDHWLLAPTFGLQGFKLELGFNLIHVIFGVWLRILVELLPRSRKSVTKIFDLFNNGDPIKVLEVLMVAWAYEDLRFI